MATTKPEAGSSGNLFLDSLPTESVARLLPYLELRREESGAVLLPAGRSISHILFPVASVISTVTRMLDGSNVEVTLVGRDGFFGVQMVLGDDVSVSEAVMQIPDSLYKMKRSDFEDCLQADATLKARALRYAQVMLENVSQFSGCNRLHPINERFARWLLMAHDRVPGDVIMITQEFLATMLGVRRPGVTLAAGTLDKAGVIEYRRGRIEIKNRAGLEAATCECYAVSNEALERLLGYSVRKGLRSPPKVHVLVTLGR